ncbi:hypothetical protein ABIE69_000331 [Rhodobacteraceae bacterium MBR-64]|jgi:hypothetical protein
MKRSLVPGPTGMLAPVREHGYGETLLPGDKATAWVCANR